MKEYSLARATLIVVTIHLILIVWLIVFTETTTLYKPRERLTVQTVSLTPKEERIAMDITPTETEKIQELPKQTTQAVKQQPAIKKEEPPKKTETPKKTEPIKKTETTKQSPVAKADPRKKELIALAKESIAKIQQNRATFKADSNASNSLVPDYRDELTARLQMMLRLPERGDVRIKLTLSRMGKFVKMEILSSDSTVNKKYVEKTLPTLQFPPFGKELNSAECSFNITLSSET